MSVRWAEKCIVNEMPPCDENYMDKEFNPIGSVRYILLYSNIYIYSIKA
jgi:hypothetical protein